MTQSPETIQRLLEQDGFENTEVRVMTDSPSSPAPSGEPSGEVPAGGELPSETGEEDEVDPDAAAPSGGATDQQEPPKTPPKPKKAGGWERKIAKKDGELATLRTESQQKTDKIAELERQLAARSTAAPASPPPATTPAPLPAEPQPKPVAKNLPEIPAQEKRPAWEDTDAQGNPKFSSEGELTEAISRWAARDERRLDLVRQHEDNTRTEAERRQTEESKRQTMVDAEKTQRAERWNSSVARARSRFTDIDAVLQRPSNPGPILLEAVLDDEQAAELAHFLTTNPAEESRIRDLTSVTDTAPSWERRRAYATALAEIEKIRMQIGGSPAPPAPAPASRETREPAGGDPPPTPAPAIPPAAAAPAAPPKPTPIRPVGSRGAPVNKKLRDMSKDEVAALDMDDFRRRREAGEG